MKIYDTESGAELQSAQGTSFSWTDHARQWLKGGVMVLGTVILSGMTYLAGSAFRRGGDSAI